MAVTKDGRAHVYRGGKLQAAQDGSREGTMAARIIAAHDQSRDASQLHLRFDALASHDITYVGIVQTARASGLERFPMPYVLTNCHNSLCAVGGTINEDDHAFGLSAAVKYGGRYVPAHLAVIHSYVREEMAACGRMILGSDSHTRYGALGTMGVGEGGPELVKQLLCRTYDAARPDVVAVYLTGAPRPGVGPQDVALALIAATFQDGFVKNKVLEFIGPGIGNLPVEYRNGIDVMTTETTCLSSIWRTDERVRRYFEVYGRPGDYKTLEPEEGARYDAAVFIDLSAVRPMIALPFHPSNALPLHVFLQDAADRLRQVEKDAKDKLGIADARLAFKASGAGVRVDQGVIAGCAGGTYDNLVRAAGILARGRIGGGAFGLSVYPGSQPVMLALAKAGVLAQYIAAGAVVRSAFCGPCFGAGDVPANGALSIRHTTRNFESREGAKPKEGQAAYVALMDARSIAATAAHGGLLTPADQLPGLEEETRDLDYVYDRSAYAARVYDGVGQPRLQESLVFGPNIADWPAMPRLPEHLLLRMDASLLDPVTTTDELIPSGETSSYRSNPLRLASFALSRKDPEYVGRARETAALEARRGKADAEALEALRRFTDLPAEEAAVSLGVGSAIFARKPGDGSAREQAASCQRVLGGAANLAHEYATKRYRSNLVNWGMLPFICPADVTPPVGSVVYVPDVRARLARGESEFPALIFAPGARQAAHVSLTLPSVSPEERDILLAGCLINYYGK